MNCRIKIKIRQSTTYKLPLRRVWRQFPGQLKWWRVMSLYVSWFLIARLFHRIWPHYLPLWFQVLQTFSVTKWLNHGVLTFLIIKYHNNFRWYRGKGNRFFSKSWLGFDPDRKSHTLLRPKAVWNWERKVHLSCCGHEAGDKEGSCRECTYFLSQRISKVRVTKD